MNIIDRRLNPGGKSLSNRQRFLRRAKALVQRAVREGSGERSIGDLERSGEVSIPAEGVREPRLRRSTAAGAHDHILPGNKRFIEGDTIERDSDGSGGGSAPGGDEEGQDDFRFVLSREEFLELFLEDLELPELAKRRLATIETHGFRRAGYSTTGSPVNLAVLRTMRNALSRRIAMRRPKNSDFLPLAQEIKLLEQKGEPSDRLESLREEFERLQQRSRRVPYIDPLDLRYRRLVPVPRPIAQAVMFCLMDVSGSMTEHMKDLAKRFYMLLYVFLKRRYRHVEIVFIRHTDRAEEVDVQTFFYGPASGGTLVSSALQAMHDIVRSRFKPADWNIYAAQASDGDNSYADGEVTSRLLTDKILPVSQFFAYLEVGQENGLSYEMPNSSLWTLYEGLRASGAPLSMRKVNERSEIFPVFHDLFQRRSQQERTGS